MVKFKPQPNKIRNILLAILSALIVASLSYILLSKKASFEPEREEKIEATKVVFIREPHLFRAGTNYELGKRNEGQKVTEFQKGDYFGISADIEIDREVVIEAQILDEKGSIIDEALMSSLKKESSGSFGLCCVLVPDNQGNYLLQLKINGTEREIDFEVVLFEENEY